MNGQAVKKSKRVRDRIYRISFRRKDGIYREPEKKFETYRRVLIAGAKKRQRACFASIVDAETFRDSGGADVTPKSKGVTLGQVVALWKRAHFPHLELPSRENILKVFPGSEDREVKSHAGRELPCDSLIDVPVEEIGPIRIDEWLAYLKRPEFLTTLKSTKLSFFHEYQVLNQALNYYASRINREYRSPFLKDHRAKLKIRDATPKAEKDLPAGKLQAFLDALAECTLGTDYGYVLPKMAEVEYRTYSRVSEAAAIHLEDTNPVTGVTVLNKRIQYLRRGEQRAILLDGHKANGGRRIHSAEVTRLLLEVAMKRGIRSGPLFFVDGKPIPYKAIQNAYDWAHRKAGTGQTGTHVLRHGSLSEFQEASKDLKQTMKVAGHSDVKSTVRYAKARDSAVSESQEQVEAKLRATRAVR